LKVTTDVPLKSKSAKSDSAGLYFCYSRPCIELGWTSRGKYGRLNLCGIPEQTAW